MATDAALQKRYAALMRANQALKSENARLAKQNAGLAQDNQTLRQTVVEQTAALLKHSLAESAGKRRVCIGRRSGDGYEAAGELAERAP